MSAKTLHQRILSLIPSYSKLLDHNYQFQRKLIATQNELNKALEDRDRFKEHAVDYTNRYERALNRIDELREKYEPELVEEERTKLDASFGMMQPSNTHTSVTNSRTNTGYDW